MVRKGMKTILLIAALLMIPTSGIVYAEEGTEPPSTETPSAAQDYPQEETKEPAIHTDGTRVPVLMMNSRMSMHQSPHRSLRRWKALAPRSFRISIPM